MSSALSPGRGEKTPPHAQLTDKGRQFLLDADGPKKVLEALAPSVQALASLIEEATRRQTEQLEQVRQVMQMVQAAIERATRPMSETGPDTHVVDAPPLTTGGVQAEGRASSGRRRKVRNRVGGISGVCLESMIVRAKDLIGIALTILSRNRFFGVGREWRTG